MTGSPPPVVRRDVPLAPLTTLRLGGKARFFADVRSSEDLESCLAWANGRHRVQLIGGGSNVVFADEGYDGLVVRMALEGRRIQEDGLVFAAAGESWDALVQVCADANLAGVECLAGIPGSVGATPIQNVGAYGQEVSEVIERVDLLERASGARLSMPGAECGFGYRTSRFKREPDTFIVLGVHLGLRPGGEPTVAYGELARALEGQDRSLAGVRSTVVKLRRRKSMVLDEADPNTRSAGSFFTNPIVTRSQAEHVVERALAGGIVAHRDEIPTYPVEEGSSCKLAAGWLIEHAGVEKGTRLGGVGVSSKHALALMNHGGGTTTELLSLARDIRARVFEAFGITLEVEPVLVDQSL